MNTKSHKTENRGWNAPVININTNKKFKMYRQRGNKWNETTIEVNEAYEGETIEEKMRRVLNNNEPITDGAPIIYTERKDGVRPEYDIRTDRFELAVEAMDIVSKEKLTKRLDNIAEREKAKIVDMKKNEGETDSGAKPM